MARKKHKWHCGRCHNDLHVTKAKKGTKYLFCPHCNHQVAYFNAGILGALGTLAKGALKAIPGVGTAISIGETVGELFGGDKKESPSQIQSVQRPIIHRAGYSTESKVHDALR